ncbi:hypothetical protein BJX99DRAFT_259894 [Aspergillus californicus]
MIQVMVAYVDPDRLSKTEDLGYVQFDGKVALPAPHWELPINVKSIKDMALVLCQIGDRVIMLAKGLTTATCI